MSEQETARPDSINLTDLQSLLNIVDIATSRGAFKGNELSQVGAVYDKLDTFLTFVAEQQQKAQEEKEAASTEEEKVEV